MINLILTFFVGMIPLGQVEQPVLFLCPKATPEIIEMCERVDMSEASNEPFDGKVAVISTLINRVLSPDYPNTFEECIDGQFSISDNGTPSEECKDAVRWAFSHPYIFPEDMYWFRNAHYHTFANPYTKIGNHYFSTKEKYE